ncbi:hypothetical protein [Nocardiopsis trehalosi]|uniref:hypothetical protein n=1 Tax=Nocardiopsis trehalosi TaxID=109329 RepID=UPI000829579B|nr:hypothetical protein [Nocardiopsis trehalosi]
MPDGDPAPAAGPGGRAAAPGTADDAPADAGPGLDPDSDGEHGPGLGPEADPPDTGDRFLAELGAAMPPDEPMPRAVRAAARAAYLRRRPDTVLTEVAADSVDVPLRAGLRGMDTLAGAPRYVRFTGPAVEVDVEVTADGDRRELVGRVAPAGATEVEVRSPRRSTRHPVDPDGGFLAHGVPRGPVSLVFTTPDATPTATPWLSL